MPKLDWFEPKAKEIWDINLLKEWEDNPRGVFAEDLERLKEQIRIAGGLYKPLLVTPKGIVLGGNQRLKVLGELGITKVWVSVVRPKTWQEMMDIAISDNGHSGYYVTAELVDRITEANWQEDRTTLFKAEVQESMKITDILAKDKENILGKDDTKDEDTTKEKLNTYENGEQKQIVLFLGSEEYKKVDSQFDEIKNSLELDTNSEVLMYMLTEYERDHVTKETNKS